MFFCSIALHIVMYFLNSQFKRISIQEALLFALSSFLSPLSFFISLLLFDDFLSCSAVAIYYDIDTTSRLRE